MLQIVVYRLSLLLGPCDGVGGRVKREADREVERNQKHIRNVGELFAYVKENFPNIEPILISEQEDRIHREAIQEEFDHAKAIKGSSKLHQYSSVPGCPNQVLVKRFSNEENGKHVKVSDYPL